MGTFQTLSYHSVHVFKLRGVSFLCLAIIFLIKYILWVRHLHTLLDAYFSACILSKSSVIFYFFFKLQIVLQSLSSPKFENMPLCDDLCRVFSWVLWTISVKREGKFCHSLSFRWLWHTFDSLMPTFCSLFSKMRKWVVFFDELWVSCSTRWNEWQVFFVESFL